MSTKNIAIALVFVSLVTAATVLELNGHKAVGLWLLVVLMFFTSTWERTVVKSADSISVLDAWEAIGHDIGVNPSKEELLASLRYMAQLAEMNDGGNPAWNAVVRERVRQVQDEGYSVEHDDHHTKGELAAAAASYQGEATVQVCDRHSDRPTSSRATGLLPYFWPWHAEEWRPAENPRRNVEIGLALGLAELERLIRAEGQEARS